MFEDEKRTFDGLFGLFNDSLPDGWGCLLLDRKLRKRALSYDSITPLSRLSMIGRNPMGALEYEPADEAAEEVGNVELDSLSGEVDKILAGNDSDVLDELLKLNGSSGGAERVRKSWHMFPMTGRKSFMAEQIRLPGLRRGSLNFPNGTIS